MDSGVAHHRCCHLARLLPSTYSPPFGERARQSERTNSHFDSHTDLTMSHHELEIPECLVWEDEPLITYGTLVGSGPSVARTSPDDPSQFLGYMNANH